MGKMFNIVYNQINRNFKHNKVLFHTVKMVIIKIMKDTFLKAVGKRNSYKL